MLKKTNLDVMVRTGQIVYMKFKDRDRASRYMVTSIPGRKLTVLVNQSGGVWYTPKTVKTHYTHPLSVLLGESATKPIEYVNDEYIGKHSYKVYNTDVGTRKTPDPVIVYLRSEDK